ncbi:hypothetical protein P692DRAFT_20758234, partial [Suillus brevipes Sb2]
MVTHRLDTLITMIYDGIDSPQPPPVNYFANRTILAARNDDVATVNAELLGRMRGEEKVYLSVDSVV